jgi:cytochrome c-type biogenesis protein CcsB
MLLNNLFDLLAFPEIQAATAPQLLEEIENSLRNATFLTLFFTTFFYWFYTAFYTKTTNKGSSIRESNIGLLRVELQTAPVPGAPSLTGNFPSILFPRICMAISNLLLVLLLIVRWEKSGHFPLSNLYESLMFLAWCCTFLYLIYSTSFTISVEKILGSLIAPCAFLMNAFATFSLPTEMQQSAPLVPALQSNWLMMHVTVMIISYATLIIGSLLSILFLILNKQKFNNSPPKNLVTNFYPSLQLPSPSKEFKTEVVTQMPKGLPSLTTVGLDGGAIYGLKTIAKINVSEEAGEPDLSSKSIVSDDKSGFKKILSNLDSLSYRIIGLGFPFLTIGILSGAVWANEAWGSYWSWDPKETWALLTWLVFAIYLHTRLTKGWQGEKPAIIASLGFMVVWFCYLGVNLIGEGLHSYGFF